jgi:hypothetical protein
MACVRKWKKCTISGCLFVRVRARDVEVTEF